MKLFDKKIVKPVSLLISLLMCSCNVNVASSSEMSSQTGSEPETSSSSATSREEVSSSTSESLPPEEDIIDKLLSLYNVTYKSEIVNTRKGSFNSFDLYDTVHYVWVYKEVETLKYDDGDIERSNASKSSDYEISFTNICKALNISNPSDSEFEELLSQNINRFT